MEYRSPLGFNFKLEQSLSASKESNNKSTSLGDECLPSASHEVSSNCSEDNKQYPYLGNRKSQVENTLRDQRFSSDFRSVDLNNSQIDPSPRVQRDSGNRRYSHGRNSQFDGTPRGQRGNWKSMNPRHSFEKSVNISQYFHPSMLEDPWKNLVNNIKDVDQV
ncbi:hypothetical protein RUM43_002947 [Polyplax serrata]|uniref:Uncharacterized protein n=1 Tax=Polyplax serrata TaxID=468196 RepID=A0AAN8NVP2_POLSC